MPSMMHSLQEIWKKYSGKAFQQFATRIAAYLGCEYKTEYALMATTRTYDVVITKDPNRIFAPFTPPVGIECKSGGFNLDEFKAALEGLEKSQSNLVVYITKTNPSRNAKTSALLTLEKTKKLICFFGPDEADLLFNSSFPVGFFMQLFVKACTSDPAGGALHLGSLIEERRRSQSAEIDEGEPVSKTHERLMDYTNYIGKLLRTIRDSGLVQCVNQAAPYHWILALGVGKETRRAMEEYRNIMIASLRSAIIMRETEVQDITELTSVLRKICMDHGKKECLQWIQEARTFQDLAPIIPEDIQEIVGRIEEHQETDQDLETDRRVSTGVLKWFAGIHFPKEAAVYRVKSVSTSGSSMTSPRHEEVIADQKHWVRTRLYRDVQNQVRVNQNYDEHKIRNRLSDWLQSFSECYWAPRHKWEQWRSEDWKKLGTFDALYDFVESEEYVKMLTGTT